MSTRQVELDDDAFSTTILALAQALEGATSKQVQLIVACAASPHWSMGLNPPNVRSQEANDRTRVLMDSLERRGAPSEASAAEDDGQPHGGLLASNDALVAATRALAKQMRSSNSDWAHEGECSSSFGRTPSRPLVICMK